MSLALKRRICNGRKEQNLVCNGILQTDVTSGANIVTSTKEKDKKCGLELDLDTLKAILEDFLQTCDKLERDPFLCNYRWRSIAL